MIILQYVVKTISLIMAMIFISFFSGILFYILCDFNKIFHDWRWEGYFIDREVYNHNLFVEEYDIDILLLVYYTFTTMSTVGLGDIHPKSDFERIIVIMILLIGVAVFSSIMEIFIKILKQFDELKKDINDDDALEQFFSMMKKFNNNCELNLELKNKIIAYF